MSGIRIPSALLIAAALTVLMSGCIDGGAVSEVLAGGDDSGTQSHPNPDPTSDGETGEAFCTFLDQWSAGLSDNDVNPEPHQPFDPSILAEWGLHDLPGDGCHGKPDPNGNAGSVTWYVADPEFCGDLTELALPQLRAAGFALADETGEVGTTVSYHASKNDNNDWVDWQCWYLDEANIALWTDQYKWPVTAGNTIATFSAYHRNIQ